MKTTLGFLAVLTVALVAVAYRDRQLSERVTETEASLDSARRKIVQLEQRVRGAENDQREVQEMLQQLRSIANSLQSRQPTASLETAKERVVESPSAAAPQAGPLAATLVLDASLLSDFNAEAFFSTRGPATMSEMAKAALVVLKTAQQDATWLANHPVMNRQIGTLATLAEALLKDDGTDPSATAALKSRFATTARGSATILRTLAAGVPNDDADARAQSQQLQTIVEQIRTRMPD